VQNLFITFPLNFSGDLLRKDLERCLQYQFIDHFNERDYVGKWTSIALRSPTGDHNNIFAYTDGTEKFHDTKILSECSYFKEVIDSFKCPKQSIRLLNLKPNSRIKEHTDYKLDYMDESFRLHIPILTNDQVIFYIDNHGIKMKQGECWYANFSLPHRVENLGDTERIHLVVDCLRNPWTDRLFKNNGYDFSLDSERARSMDKEKTLKVIAELERMNSETSRKLIKDLKDQLNR
jgi:hypothetical protein